MSIDNMPKYHGISFWLRLHKSLMLRESKKMSALYQYILSNLTQVIVWRLVSFYEIIHMIRFYSHKHNQFSVLVFDP